MQPSSKIHFPSVFQLLFSGLGLAVFLTSAVSMLVLGTLSLTGSALFGGESLALFSLAWTAGISGLLLVPSAAHALMRLMGRPLPGWKLARPLRAANLALLAWPAVWGLGTLASGNETAALWVLPPAQVLLIGIPLVWLVERGRAGLAGGSPQRRWGLLGFSLTIIPTLAVVAEILAIAAVAVLISLWISSQPALLQEITRLGERLVYAQMNPELIQKLISPFLQRPGVLFGILAFTAGIVPLLEEAIKPLALWGFAGKRLTPAEGFVMGAICGATFALFESLGMFLSAVSGQEWAVLMLGRTGTGILHTVTSAVMGWGLASAWSHKEYLRLGASYLAAISLHSVWNVFAMLMGLSDLLTPEDSGAVLPLSARLGNSAPVVLALLAVMMLAIFFGLQSRLRKEVPLPGGLPDNR